MNPAKAGLEKYKFEFTFVFFIFFPVEKKPNLRKGGSVL